MPEQFKEQPEETPKEKLLDDAKHQEILRDFQQELDNILKQVEKDNELHKKDPKDFKIQRTISVFREMIRRGKELESNLGLIGGHFGWLGAPEVISPKGLRRFITHTWGIRFIYGVILAMWIVILIAFFIN